MFEWNEEEKKIDFSHNPFSMPNMAVEEFLALDAKDNEKLLVDQGDPVRHRLQRRRTVLRRDPQSSSRSDEEGLRHRRVSRECVGGEIRRHAARLSLGAPPHGGIAPGIDRIVMLLAGEENLREVVLFPMNQRAEDLMMGAPSEAAPKQLKELHIRLDLPKK